MSTRADETLFCGTVTSPRSDGSFTYTPARGFHGVDYFFYQLSAATETSLPAAVKISVGTPPVGVTDTYSMLGNNQQPHPLVVDAPGVLRNDLNTVTSPSATTFAVLLSQPAFGKLTFNPFGGFTYLPNVGFTGTDSFTYVPSIGSLAAEVAGIPRGVIELQGNPTTVILNVR